MSQQGLGEPKQTWMETIKKDMLMLHISEEITLNKGEYKKRIHVVTVKNWDKDFVIVVHSQE